MALVTDKDFIAKRNEMINNVRNAVDFNAAAKQFEEFKKFFFTAVADEVAVAAKNEAVATKEQKIEEFKNFSKKEKKQRMMALRAFQRELETIVKEEVKPLSSDEERDKKEIDALFGVKTKKRNNDEAAAAVTSLYKKMHNL